MTSVNAKIGKWGNGLGIHLSAKTIKENNLKEGDYIEVEIKKVNSFPSDLTEYLKMKGWNGSVEKTEEIKWGDPVGEEEW